MSLRPATATWYATLALIAILLLATGLRFYKLDAQSFWNDEGNSARLSERSPELILEGTASDIHPPLYYLLLRGWRELLGESEFGLRSFSVFVGILTVAAVPPLASLFFKGSNVVSILLAAFFAALNPALIYYSQETRMYALLALLAALTTAAFYRWLVGGGLKWVIAFILLSTAGMYTHYFYPSVLIFQSLILGLVWLKIIQPLPISRAELNQHLRLSKKIGQWLGMMAVLFILYLPWLPVFIRQAGGRDGMRSSLTSFVWDSLRWVSFGETIQNGELLWPVLAVILLIIWGIVIGRRESIIPLLGLGIPILFMFAAGTTEPTFFKFLLVAVPFFALLISRGFDNPDQDPGKKRFLWFAIPSLLLIFFLMGTAVSLNNLYNNPAFARADYRQMAARINREGYPNAGIILNAPNQWEVFTYYHQAGAPVYPLPLGQPDPAILEPQLADISAKHDRIYGIFWGEQQRDPQNIVENWLDNHAFKTSEEWIGEVRFVVYTVPQEPPTAMQTSLGLLFGEFIELEGYSLKDTVLKPGELIQITLYWNTAEPLDKRYKVFLHLLDENGQLIAQRDDEPVGGQRPMVSWLPGEQIIDNYGLVIPEDLPSGQYDLLVGLYEIEDPGSRLLVQTEDQQKDFHILTSITVDN